MTLRTRLVLWSVTLIAVVCTVVGTVTALAFHAYLRSELDQDLRTSIERAVRPQTPLGPTRDLSFIASPGHPLGTVGARLDHAGRIVESARSEVASTDSPTRLYRFRELSDDEQEGLAQVALDGKPHTAQLAGLGEYRVQTLPTPDGAVLLGMPTAEVNEAVGTVVLVEVCVTAAGLVAAGIAVAAMVPMALRPLRRVAATATRVSQLRLDRGEVEPLERVPDRDIDPRTEVGQVGAALNRLLGHVGSALAARQESETRVRQFVADASHELRTPLAAIRGYAELTRRRPEETGPDTRHALTRIESEAGRMTVLVEDLLLLARLDAGRPLAQVELDVSPLVVDAVSDARTVGPGHHWRLVLPEEPATVRGDAARLQQVLANLLANARTHTPEGTTVTARVRHRSGGVLVEVEDDGPGIGEQLLPHVFERFARGDVARSQVHTSPGGASGQGASGVHSTGLGLAIVQAVVLAHQGEVSVASVPGRTTFAVWLPTTSVQRGGSDNSQLAHSVTTRR